jgi:hypothetical protein
LDGRLVGDIGGTDLLNKSGLQFLYTLGNVGRAVEVEDSLIKDV